MITVNDPALTNILLIEELGLWELFDSKSIKDDKTKQYYQLIDDLLDSQIGESIAWLQSDEAKEHFFKQSELQKEIFDALEDSWDTIFDGHYEKVDNLLDAIYDEGKKQGYSNIKETLNYTDADIQAIRLAKDYNYDLIRSLSDDLRGTVKNKILQGIIMGENPYNLSRTLTKAGVTKLDGSPFTARQRATMIAKTETSRMQNTGMLQSYVNEGYTQVKILTAEDSDVCTTCLEYAYKFNKDEPRVYSPELLKREKVHDIVALIKGGKFPPFHPYCYMPDTQVFTNHGWKYFYDITKDDKILSLNPETKTTEFLDYVKVIAHENSQGYMYHIHNKWFDTCVTSDHDCFIYQRKEIKGERVKVPEFRKPDELNSESYFLRTIKNDNVSQEHIDINGLKFKASDYAFFMAWYLSEGSILHNHESAKNHAYPIKISQEISINREILENELKRIFNYLGLKVAVGKSYFEIYSKELYDYLEPLGYCHEMYVPNELFSLNQDDLRLFIENYIRGDGHARKSHNDLVTNSYENTIVTSSLNLVNDLSYIILLAGYYPSISLHSPKGTVTKYHNGEYASNHDVYCLRVNRSNFTQFANCTVDKIPYEGMVYCIELPKYHTLWTKRNGKTSWNGNCRCTYLTVWETKEDAPDNPPVINLTPVGAEIRRHEDNLPEPTKEQLYKNLRPGEREKYESYKKNIPKQKEWLKNNPDAPAEEIAKHQKRLAFLEKKFNELKKKALGADANIPVNKPKAKPKPVETPKPESPKVDSPTDKPKKKPEEKPVEAKPQNKPTNVNLNETLSDLRKDLPITDEAFDEILKWSKKRVKNKTRYGREYNTNTGEFHPLESKGNEYVLQFRTRDSPEVMRITTMSKGHQGPPDSTDFKLARASENQDFLFISDKEVWYIHTPENFGISSVNNGQNDLMAVYRKANQDASKKVYDLIKEGKLSRNNRAALSEAQDKFLGENLLKELNSKEWQDKGFVVRRAERDDIKTRKTSTSKPKSNTKEAVDTTKIDKSKLTYDNIKTPEEVAAYYDLEYVPELNAKGKIVSQKFIDHMTYVDPKTGEKFNHKMEIVFDSTFVGPSRRKAKNLIDTTNSGQCKYDQKELIRICKEAPEVYKFATGSINFTGKDRYANRSFQPNELGNASYYRSYEFKNNKYYLKGVNSIMIPYLPLSVNHGNRGTAKQTLYHEMSHCFDYSLMKGEPRDLMVKGITTGLSREEIIKLNQYLKAGYGHGLSGDKSWKDIQKDEYDYQGKNNYPQEGASWYGTVSNAPEHWAETGSMAAISLTDDLTDAVMEDYRRMAVHWDKWRKYHKPTLDYAINKIKTVTPDMFSYNSNLGIKTVKPKSKPKTESKPKTKKLNPVEAGKVKKFTSKEYPHLDYIAPKTIEYEDGTVLKFKSIVTNPEAPDYTSHTLDEIKINGKTLKYKQQGKSYDDFKYQDKQFTKAELAFADEFIKHYGTYAGIKFNEYQMGKLSKKDYAEIKDDASFKWLVKNADKYDKLLEKTTLEEDTVTVRVKTKNHIKPTDKHVQDKMYTSSSAGRSITDLIDNFANGRDLEDNWIYITVNPKGTKGARYQGNSIIRNEGQDMDFEEEITYKRNFKFDVVLYDEVNKIIILTPG